MHNDCKKYCKECVKIKEISNLLRVLGEPNRLRVVCYLLEGSKSAGDIGKSLDIPHNLVSFHLKSLFEKGFLTRKKKGSRIYYSIKPSRRDVIESVIGLFE